MPYRTGKSIHVGLLKRIHLINIDILVPTLCVNAIKLRNIVGWVERERNEVAGRPTHHCYKFQAVGGFRSALPTLQKKRIFSFPRSAWECLPGRSASCNKQKRKNDDHTIISATITVCPLARLVAAGLGLKLRHRLHQWRLYQFMW